MGDADQAVLISDIEDDLMNSYQLPRLLVLHKARRSTSMEHTERESCCEEMPTTPSHAVDMTPPNR